MTMQCRHCQSEMEQTESITEGGARQTWYRCPVCAANQTVSQPHQARLQRIGNAQRCSSAWPESGPIDRIDRGLF
jgi:hypothetical protein